MFITSARVIFFILYIPIAAAVPSIVEMIDATAATISVFKRLFSITSLWNSFEYQSSVKPVQTERLFDSLN